MKLKLLALFLLATCLIYGRGSGKVFIPDKYIDWGKDTNFYNIEGAERKILNTIRKGNHVFEYSVDGNLTSITEIKPDGVNDWIDTSKKENIEKRFKLDGLCYLYFDDSTLTLAGIGEFINNERGENWRYFDRNGRLTEHSFHMPIWTRTDYYDTSGKITEEVDYTTCINDRIKVRDMQYVNGQKKVIVNKMFIDTFILHFMAYYTVILFFFFFSRVLINIIFYTREGTKFKVYFGMFYTILLASLFSFWFTKYKPENRWLAKLNNSFFLISMGMFFGMFILMIINGDIK